MQLWQDGLVASLAAVGLAALIWAAARALTRPRSFYQLNALALIPARGDAGQLQQQIQAFIDLGRSQGAFGRILLVDCGLDSDGIRLCRILERENRWVIFCRPEDVAEYCTTET